MKNIKRGQKFEMSFQSRFGPQEWLRPYMNEKMDELIKEEKEV